MNQTIDCYFLCYEKQVAWQQKDISVSQLSEGAESPDLVLTCFRFRHA